MEDNKEHTAHIDEIIKKVFADDPDGMPLRYRNAAASSHMRKALRKVASAAMMDGFESGYQIGYDSGFKHGAKSGTINAINNTGGI